VKQDWRRDHANRIVDAHRDGKRFIVRADENLTAFEIALMLVCFDHVSRCIVNPNHNIMSPTEKLRISDCIPDSVRFTLPQPTERERIGNWINAATIFCASGLRKRRGMHPSFACMLLGLLNSAL
jgi:hypothetical protein